MNSVTVSKTSISKININKTVFSLFVILLCNLVFTQLVTAAPLKISDARWKTGWNHPGANTSLSSSQKTITTILPPANTITSDYNLFFNVFTNAGNPLPITVRPLTHTSMIKCPTFTPGPNKPIISSYCTASRYTSTDGMIRLTQPTTIKIEVKSAGGGKKYLFWKFIPQGTTASAPGNNTAANQTQIYDVGPGQINSFFQTAKNRNYTFSASIIESDGDEILGFKPRFFPSSSVLEINFGTKTPAILPPSAQMSVSQGNVRVNMFDGVKTLKPGWTFEHASYRNPPGESCRRSNVRESRRSNSIHHRFDVSVVLIFTPPLKACSRLFLQRIRLKGPKGMKAEDALRE